MNTMKTNKMELIKDKVIDKDYFYDLVLRIKLTPSKWYVLPFIYKGSSFEDDVSLFRFEWLFFSIELQRWENLVWDGEDFTETDNL